MSRTRGWTGLRNSLVAMGLGLAAWASIAGVAGAASIPASPLIAYETSGTIGATGVTTTGGVDPTTALKFTSLMGASLESPSALSLGAFQAAPLAAGQSVTYNNTPVDIKLTVTGVDNATGSNIQPNQTPIDITGTLNGTLSGKNQSSVTATFSPTSYLFATGLYSNTLDLSSNPLTIVVPSSSNSGMATVQGMLTTAVTPAVPAPEPSTIVLFTATVAGLGLRRRLHLRRHRA